MSAGETTVTDPLATTPMPTHCTKWPCTMAPGRSVLTVNDQGFLVCSSCGYSYGKADRPPDFYSALCFQEPWLELILLNLKTLETRTKCLSKAPHGRVVLVSSKNWDTSKEATTAGMRLDTPAMQRAEAGLGKMRGICTMGGFVPGTPVQDDAAACIPIRMTDGSLRFVSKLTGVQRIREVASVRVQDKGGKITIVKGAAQGFYRVPSEKVKIL